MGSRRVMADGIVIDRRRVVGFAIAEGVVDIHPVHKFL